MHLHQRISVGGCKGTVRYLGSLNDTGIQWVGVEWDEPSRGRHSGTYEGRSIFSCAPGSGSFIKLAKVKLDQTFSFSEALERKYATTSITEIEHNSVVPGISKPVESVGFDRAADDFARISNLSNVSLENCFIDRIEVTEAHRSLLSSEIMCA